MKPQAKGNAASYRDILNFLEFVTSDKLNISEYNIYFHHIHETVKTVCSFTLRHHRNNTHVGRVTVIYRIQDVWDIICIQIENMMDEV